ncbi:MAG TPA: hypothetical protein VJR27_00170 [Candidatus Saccharimonadales bacterium]|nr:hypothetical protein [Candidatus Saccharimonadales bacterium]
MPQNKPKDTKPKSTKPKVFDVSKPGGSAPTSSARPLIVTHRPMVQDPMVTKLPVDDPLSPTEGAPEVPKTLLKTQKIKLQPSPAAIQELAERAAAEHAADPTPPPEKTAVVDAPASVSSSSLSDSSMGDLNPAKPTPEVAPAEPVSLAPAEKPAPPQPTPETPTDEEMLVAPQSLVVETPSQPEPKTEEQKPAEQAPSSKNATEQASKREAEKEVDLEVQRKQAYEQVIDSHKYYVHISSPTKKRSMRLAVVGAIIIILVAVGCVDAMLDAGVLTLSGVPHTHFIK